jgi:hypothetical protein
MTLDEMEDGLEGGEALFLEPRSMLDEAIIGLAERADGMMVVAYDTEKVVQALMKGNDWDEEEAREWYSFNTAGAYVGPGTPVFINLLTPEPGDSAH